MKAEDFFCRIGVKFIDKNGKVSQKTYNYLITKEWINSKKNSSSDIVRLTSYDSVFKIITEDDYDYKGAEVIIVNVDRSKGNYNFEQKYLKVIKDLIYSRADLSVSFISNPFKNEDFCEGKNFVSELTFNACDNNTIDVTNGCVCTSEIVSSGINLTSEISNIQKEIKELKNKESEENKMFNFENLRNKFQFGEYKEAKMSPYGIAFKAMEGYYAVNIKTMELIDATGLVFDFECVYAMPVAANAVKNGDFILHNRMPVLVRKINPDGSLECWNIKVHEVVTTLPVKSPFGFNFYTKLVSLIDNMGMTPTNDNPFGNIWPLLLMDSKKDNKDMMMFMMLMNQQGGQFNPMIMYMMMDENKSNFLPMMLMMNGGFNFGMAPTDCKRNDSEEHGDYSKIMNGEA